MQQVKTDSFKSRVLFNASKAYVRQFFKGKEYIGLQPVYALSIVNEIFEPKSENWYHHYRMVHMQDQENVIDGLQLIFVELPKFKPQKFSEKKLNVLWLRYLREIKHGQEMIEEELLKELQSVPEIALALELTKESSYTAAELEAYDKYWDTIAVEKTFIADAEARGLAEGEARGEARGKAEEKVSIVCNAYKKLKDIDIVADITSLSKDQVVEILKVHNLI